MSTTLKLRIKVSGAEGEAPASDDFVDDVAPYESIEVEEHVQAAADAKPALWASIAFDEADALPDVRSTARVQRPARGKSRAQGALLGIGGVTTAVAMAAVLLLSRAGGASARVPAQSLAAAAPAAVVEVARPAVVEAPPVAPAPAASPAASSSCAALFSEQKWKAAAEACAEAFASNSSAALALRTAKALYARGLFSEAAGWGARAAALDDTLAEAQVMIGEGERRAGNTAAAEIAFRKYLKLAPRGWHARQVRAALASL